MVDICWWLYRFQCLVSVPWFSLVWMMQSLKSCFLRMIPTLKHFSDILSDIPSGSTHGIYIYIYYMYSDILLAYILTFYLTSFWHSIWHLFRHSFWHSIWHLVWHSIWPSIWDSFWHSFWPLSDILSGLLSDILSDILCDILHSQLRPRSAHWDLELAVKVRQRPLRSGARGRGPAVPTAIWSSWLRSGSAHWDLELAVEGGVRSGRWRTTWAASPDKI